MAPRKNRRNLYRVLHVQPDAPEAVIRASYRTIMQKLRQHPDLGGDEWNAAIINEAYAVLSNRRRRAEYDARLFRETDRKDVAQGTRPSHRSEDTEADTGHPSGHARERHEPRHPRAACPFCGLGVVQTGETCPRCQAPLGGIGPTAMTLDTRRRIERLPVTETVRVFRDWRQVRGLDGVLCDFSPMGCKLRTNEEFNTGDRVRITNRSLTAIGLVHACRPCSPDSGSGYDLAIEFLGLRLERPPGGFVSVEA